MLHITPIVEKIDEIIQLNGAHYSKLPTWSIGGSINLNIPQQHDYTNRKCV
jgi:hypothetical protein